MHVTSLWSCLPLCDPTDCSLPGSSVYEILQARALSGFPCPPPGDLRAPEMEPMSPVPPASQADSLPLSHWGSLSAGDPGFIPGLGRSLGEGNGYSLQYSCLGKPTDRGVWRATIHGVAKGSATTEQLNNSKAKSWEQQWSCWGQDEKSRRDSILKTVIHFKDRM